MLIFKYSTPLTLPYREAAQLSEPLSLECTRLLLERGHADPLIEDDNGANAIVAHCGGIFVSTLRLDSDESNTLGYERRVVRPYHQSLKFFGQLFLLLERLGCDINSRGRYGRSSLHFYLANRRVHGIGDYSTGLHSYVLAERMIEVLLDHGADSHAITRHGDTPTSIAMDNPFLFCSWRNAILMK